MKRRNVNASITPSGFPDGPSSLLPVYVNAAASFDCRLASRTFSATILMSILIHVPMAESRTCFVGVDWQDDVPGL
jgi:hypothetical protein